MNELKTASDESLLAGLQAATQTADAIKAELKARGRNVPSWAASGLDWSKLPALSMDQIDALLGGRLAITARVLGRFAAALRTLLLADTTIPDRQQALREIMAAFGELFRWKAGPGMDLYRDTGGGDGFLDDGKPNYQTRDAILARLDALAREGEQS